MNAATSQPGAQHSAQRGADQAESGDATGLGRVLEPGVIDTSHGPILYLEDLTVQFDGFRALNKLSLSIDHGELRCVIGPNGAGKTGPRNANVSGRVFLGQSIDLMRMTEPRIAQVGIGRKFQKPTVFEQHEVWENLELAMKADKRWWSSLRARLTGEGRRRIEETLALTGLEDEAYRPAGLLNSLRGSCSMMVVEHDMEFVAALAGESGKVSVLAEGSLLAEGTLDAVKRDERVIESYLGR